MPSHPKPPHKKPALLRSGMAASQVLGFVDEANLSGLLAPWVPDMADRAFIVRCLVGEGPIHHRGANYILLALLGQLLRATPSPERQPQSITVAVPMRLPPHLSDDVPEGVYPLALPTDALLALAGGDSARLDAMVDCLTDGPPQHALANVLMVTLIEHLLAALARQDPP